MKLSMFTRLRSSVFAFPLAAVAALAMLIISESSFEEASTSFAVLGERGLARIAIQTLWRNLNEAETGQRGYLLTGRPEYLAPYTAAVPSVEKSLSWLKQFYAKDAEASNNVQQITMTVHQKLSELKTSIGFYDAGKHDAWRELMLSNIGKEKMDEAQILTERLLKRESASIAIDRDGVLQTLMLNRIGVAAMTAVSLLALFMYLRQTAALDRAQSERQRIVDEEHNRLEGEVLARTELLRELAQHLQTVREDERSRLARELHDELGALLTAAKLDVARMKSRLSAATPEVLERLAHLNEQLNSGIALKRRIIEDLRPSSLSNLGLVAALEILLREFGSNTEITVIDRLQAVELEPACELTVFRLVQEALTNIAKYAHATEVVVTLKLQDEETVHVSVQDNGQGFDTNLPRIATHGLIGMRFRVEAEGGKMELVSALGEGTTIEARLPRVRKTPVNTLSHQGSELSV